MLYIYFDMPHPLHYLTRIIYIDCHNRNLVFHHGVSYHPLFVLLLTVTIASLWLIYPVFSVPDITELQAEEAYSPTFVTQ